MALDPTAPPRRCGRGQFPNSTSCCGRCLGGNRSRGFCAMVPTLRAVRSLQVCITSWSRSRAACVTNSRSRRRRRSIRSNRRAASAALFYAVACPRNSWHYEFYGVAVDSFQYRSGSAANAIRGCMRSGRGCDSAGFAERIWSQEIDPEGAVLMRVTSYVACCMLYDVCMMYGAC